MAEYDKMVGYGLTIFLVAVIFGIGSMILTDVQDTSGMSSVETPANETHAIVKTVAEQLNYVDIVESSLVIYNVTAAGYVVEGIAVSSGNYTVDAKNGQVTFVTGSGYSDGANMTFVYSRNVRSTAYVIMNNGTNATGTIASWIPTIALVLAAAIIIGLVTATFVYQGKN